MIRSIALVALLLVGFIAAPAQELTLDQIIQKNTEAVGGADAVKAVQSLSITGKMVMGGGQLEMPVTIKMKRPSMSRLDAELQGRTMTRAFDGATAWQVMPMMGSTDPQKMGEKETQDVSEADLDSQIGLLSASRAKAQSMELIGKEELEGSQSYKIKVTRKSGNVVYMWLDAATFLPIRSSAKVSQMGQQIEVDSYPTNYKKVGGVVMAHSSEQKVGGRAMMQMIFEKVEVNPPIDDGIFKMPAPAPQPEAKKPEEKKN
jgi:outer membrane lipoprotein-sorting protein